MRAFVDLWDEITEPVIGIADRSRRFADGVQVTGSLTEQQPENNVYRILREMLAVVLSKKARSAPSSFRPGMRRSACRARSTSNGRSGCSRSWPTRPTCS